MRASYRRPRGRGSATKLTLSVKRFADRRGAGSESPGRWGRLLEAGRRRCRALRVRAVQPAPRRQRRGSRVWVERVWRVQRVGKPKPAARRQRQDITSRRGAARRLTPGAAAGAASSCAIAGIRVIPAARNRGKSVKPECHSRDALPAPDLRAVWSSPAHQSRDLANGNSTRKNRNARPTACRSCSGEG